ncbi:MAG: hypothetical protein F4X41_08990 [Chloroflexi bacterium]|nr:hypothetical protein [Chloroflexota bacterium]
MIPILHLIALSGKAYLGSLASGRVANTRMPEIPAPSQGSFIAYSQFPAIHTPFSPPDLDQPQQEELTAAALSLSGMAIANRYWKVVRRFVSDRLGVSLSRSDCLNYQHRLGFAFKRPRRRPRRVGFGRYTYCRFVNPSSVAARKDPY